MKKIFLSKLLLTLCLTLSGVFSCFAEDSYRALLKQMMEASGNLVQGKDKVVESFSPLMMKLGSSESAAKDFAAKFYEEDFLNDALDWMETSFKPSVSEGDLKSALAFFTSPAGQLAQEHSKTYNSEDAQKRMMAKMLPDLMKMATGEKVGTVESSAPKDYQKLFRDYYKLSGLEKSMSVLTEQIVNMTGGEDQKLKSLLVGYFDKNLETLLMDGGYPTVTKEDLTNLVNFFKSASGKKVSEANAKVLKSAMQFGLSEVMKFQMKARNEVKKLGSITNAVGDEAAEEEFIIAPDGAEEPIIAPER